jgi:hypothetical protein
MAKQTEKQKKKIAKVMREFKKKKLPIGKPTETQVEKVGGQKRMLPEKKRSAKWY